MVRPRLTLDTQNNRHTFTISQDKTPWSQVRPQSHSGPQIENKPNKIQSPLPLICLGTGKGKCSSLANINCLSACTCYSESSHLLTGVGGKF